MKKEKHLKPDKSFAAICGLYCVACKSYLDTMENPESLEKRARAAGRPVEDLRCLGCRSDTLNYFCREHCYMKSCAAQKQIDFCVECPEYPCAELKAFQEARPHRLELWESQARIAEAGYETWSTEMLEHYTCPSCDAINSAYDAVCCDCGREPSCAYVEEHAGEMRRFD